MISFPTPLQQIYTLLAVGAVIGVVSTYPYVATAIAYRQRDNGLSYLLLVMGVGIWNGMFAAQLLSPEPLVKVFFLTLDMTGGLLAGLGWFLFAATASSTPLVPNRRIIYGTTAVLVGIDITLAVTTPVHTWYWVLPPVSPPLPGFAVVIPKLGYWLHTELLVILFAGGTLLFAAAWNAGNKVRYTRGYTIAGTATVVALIGSNVLRPGGLTVAPLIAVSLTTVGWVQAQRGQIYEFKRTWHAFARFLKGFK